jgi:hypothetical protein
VKYLQDGGCGPTKGFYFFTVGIQQGDQAARAEDRPFGSLLHARQKELDLYFPVSGGVNAREEIVIDLAIVFEIQTQVEDRLRQRAAATEQESDEKTSESSVAVEKWVESLELHMGQSGPNKKRQILSLRMEKHLELPMHSVTSSGGGGTNAALPGRVPPIQFWLRRNSPGSLLLPRPRESRISWISRMRRNDSGKPSRMRLRP